MKRTNFINKKLTKQSGITLIALVLTIIILLILATVSIQVLTGDNGLLQKAQTAKEENEDAKELELIKLAVSAAQLAGQGSITTDNLNGELRENFSDNSINVDEKSGGWFFKKNKEYTIFDDGKIQEGNLLLLLPKEYQQVEYIESSGTQWIDAKINEISKKIQIKIKFMLLNKKDHTLFCCRTSPFNSRTLFILQLDGFRNDQNNQQIQINEKLQLNTVYTVDSSQTYLKLNDKILYEYPENTGIDLNNTFTILNCNNYLDFSEMSNIFGFEGKIYYYEIHDDKLIRNFIPCYATTTVTDVDGIQRQAGTVGLYDTVEGKFYVNKGTGTFGYGMEDGTYVEPSPTNN